MSRVVLLHGGGVGPWMWRAVAERLPEGHEVLTPALDGHGATGAPTFTDQAAAARAVARDVVATFGAGAVTLAGFSLGGQVALQLAATRPELVARLVVISSLLEPLPGAGLTAWLARAAAPLAARPWFARLQARQLGVPEERFDDYLGTASLLTPESLANLTRANASFEAAPLLARLTAPVTLVHGEAEPRPVAAGMRPARERLPGAALVSVPGAGHTLPLTHPELVARLVARPEG